MAPALDPRNKGFELLPGQYLEYGDYLMSPNGKTALRVAGWPESDA